MNYSLFFSRTENIGSSTLRRRRASGSQESTSRATGASLSSRSRRNQQTARRFHSASSRRGRTLDFVNFINSMISLLFLQESKRSDDFMAGRCDANVKVIFPRESLPRNGVIEDVQSGDYVAVKVPSRDVIFEYESSLCSSSLFFNNRFTMPIHKC